MPQRSATSAAVWCLASLVGTTAAAQSAQDGAAETRSRTTTSATSLERIRRGLELERDTFAPALGRLDFRDPGRELDGRPAVTMIPGFEFVGGVDLWTVSNGGGLVPVGGPTHAAMMTAMTPLDFRQVASTDALGIATASAFAVGALAVATMVNSFRGDEVDLTVRVLSESEETTVLAGTRAGTEILHAGIDQRGRTVELSLVVPDDTPPDRARALGGRFLWLVKATARDEPAPELTPGTGTFDYVVRVSSPSDTVVAQGGKTTTETAITWQAF